MAGEDIATDALHVLRRARSAAVAGVRAMRRRRARRSGGVVGATVSVRHNHLELFVSPCCTACFSLSLVLVANVTPLDFGFYHLQDSAKYSQ